MSDTHIDSVDFLYNKDHYNVVNDTISIKRGILSRYKRKHDFFAKGVITNVKFLEIRDLPLFGGGRGGYLI